MEREVKSEMILSICGKEKENIQSENISQSFVFVWIIRGIYNTPKCGALHQCKIQD